MDSWNQEIPNQTINTPVCMSERVFHASLAYRYVNGTGHDAVYAVPD
jgi:hypothetical protein